MKQNHPLSFVGKAALLLAGSALLFGCNAIGTQTANVDSSRTPKVSVEDRLKQIDSDPNMPPQAKEAAKASILAHQNAPQMGAGQPPAQK